MGIKDKIVEAAASVTQQAKNRTGPFGKAIGGVERAVDELSNGWDYLRKEFGDEYTAMCTDLKQAGITIRRKTQELCDYVDSNFYSDGEFDSEKARDALRNHGEAVRQYGAKFCRTLGELVEKGKDTVVADFKKYIPTEEDLNSGIGTEYNWTLLRPHYQACMDFIADAGEKISHRSKYRDSILADIKASASANPQELKAYYANLLTRNDSRTNVVADRLKTLDRYFPN